MKFTFTSKSSEKKVVVSANDLTNALLKARPKFPDGHRIDVSFEAPEQNARKETLLATPSISTSSSTTRPTAPHVPIAGSPTTKKLT